MSQCHFTAQMACLGINRDVIYNCQRFNNPPPIHRGMCSIPCSSKSKNTDLDRKNEGPSIDHILGPITLEEISLAGDLWITDIA
jgi:hypothetical protein